MQTPKAIVQDVEGFRVVRDDLIEGGTKIRAVLALMQARQEQEFVYASPAFGFAQVALAQGAKALGRRATIFVAKRAVLHPLTLKASSLGAKIQQVPVGYLTVCKARARAYAEQEGAFYVPFGLDCPAALDAIARAAYETGEEPEEVWSVAGSGVLTRGLQIAWPRASFHAVIIGKKDSDLGRAKPWLCSIPFEKPSLVKPPFPSVSNYDAKGWTFIKAHGKKGSLFWNVAA